MCKYFNETAEQGWAQTYRRKKGLWKKTIGLVGFGMIAQNLARMLQPFDVKLKIYSGYLSEKEAEKYNATVCSLEELFDTCDIISVHFGLNEKNYHLIDKTCLGRMKENALLVNTARGAVINEEDLVQELRKGKINAILDVYETEPLPMDSGLRGLPNAILVPHQGGPTTDVREMVTLALIEDIKRYAAGGRNLDHQISSEYASRMTDESRFKDRK
ncbi:NAD(P)-dependent oxidoreductase [Acetivibrio sp. MSJd-27]|uniref:NAD(P)-dependent oxidoreductase n=1 Tax=Acetivibrio sp. MSJd-27 TaxID=2841523 RepID=UPI002111BF27|nr:NAD(P)-dependent oxidoreductase [Acetivibrio sp. MSJd-27]